MHSHNSLTSACAGVGLPNRASLTGRRGLVRASDASGRRHRPPVVAWYWVMRPRSLSAMSWSSPRPGRSALRARLAAVGPGRCRCPLPALGACSIVRGELLAESAGVLGVQVDLVVGAADPEPHRFLRRATIEIVFEDDGYLRCIVASMPVMGHLHGTDHLPYRDQPQRPGRRPRPPIPGSQTGSQRQQTPGHVGRQPAMVSAACWPIRPRPATCSDAANAPEKRKVGGSIPPLTTTLQPSYQSADLRKAATDRRQLRSGIDRRYPSVTVIRRSMVHVGCTKLDHQLALGSGADRRTCGCTGQAYFPAAP